MLATLSKGVWITVMVAVVAYLSQGRGVPLMFGLWQVALIFSLLNAAVLWIRIRAEEGALGVDQRAGQLHVLLVVEGRRARRLADDLDATRFLFESPHVRIKHELADFAADCFPPGTPVLVGTQALMAKIFREFPFDLIRIGIFFVNFVDCLR